MENLFIQEIWLNKTLSYSCGESDVYETFTSNKGELFRHLQKEYGRCISKLYIDSRPDKEKVVGWVFEKRTNYTDVKKTYLLETWVSIHTQEPVTYIKYHYA